MFAFEEGETVESARRSHGTRDAKKGKYMQDDYDFADAMYMALLLEAEKRTSEKRGLRKE